MFPISLSRKWFVVTLLLYHIVDLTQNGSCTLSPFRIIHSGQRDESYPMSTMSNHHSLSKLGVGGGPNNDCRLGVTGPNLRDTSIRKQTASIYAKH